MNKKTGKTTIALDSLGCKLNQAEIELLYREFIDAGYKIVTPTDKPDIYILNTCTVTHIADRKTRHLLRLAHRRNHNTIVIAIGCYAQRARDHLNQIEGVNLILPNSEKSHLPQILKERGWINNSTYHHRILKSHDIAPRTRAFIKIQDGCDSSCSYCIVPIVRGCEISLPFNQITSEVRQRIAHGYKEIVLTGVNIGRYYNNGINLKGLIEHILAEYNITRLRLSSLQPMEISPDFIGLWNDKRLCRHIHLSLQSGSKSVLCRMNRSYSPSEYQQAVSLIRATIPEVAITTDIIVGFPGETDKEFHESYNFCQQLGFARIHVFPFSPRQGTRASQMPNQVRDIVKKPRNQNLLALAKECTEKHIYQFLGMTMPVLWERKSGSTWSGLTDNYIKVYTQNDENLTNKILPVKLTEVRGEKVWGY
jgi:threonylcarbamoyladenosine tRNA methylthiotransferase MtaB